jgi:hypothetical protein
MQIHAKRDPWISTPMHSHAPMEPEPSSPSLSKYQRISERLCATRPHMASGTQWLEDRQGELLPVPYFHVVFTMPPRRSHHAFQNKAAVYAILFKTAIEALTTPGANHRRLGGTSRNDDDAGARIGRVRRDSRTSRNKDSRRSHPRSSCLGPIHNNRDNENGRAQLVPGAVR